MRRGRFVRSALLLGVFGASACGGQQAPAPPVVPAPTAKASASTREAAETPKARPVRRVLVNQTRPSGYSLTTKAADGTVTIVFDVNDNGRGPHTDATLRLADDGTVVALSAKGHHDLGTAFEEEFTKTGSRASWKSSSETGARDLTEKAFFVPIADLPEANGLLAEALLRAGGPMALLPSGRARLEKSGDLTVSAHGEQRHLTLYQILGLEVIPIPVWMNDDGTWFGVVDPTSSLVPEGWDSAIDRLVEKQEELRKARDLEVAKRTAHVPPAAGTVLTHARVLDVERGRWLADHTVVVQGGVVKALGPSASVKGPKGAEVVDVSGKAVIPGLWDMHEHLIPSLGALDVACGITTARDVGTPGVILDDAKKHYDDGTSVGPHLIRFGFIEGRGEKAASAEITAENEAEAMAAVAQYEKRGYEGIKIYNSIKPELVPILAREAHKKGMLVTGHIPVHMLANEAVRAGYDGIEHVNMLFLNFLATHETDTRTTARFSLVGEGASGIDLGSKPVTDFFALLREHHVTVTPTLVTFEQVFLGEQGRVVPGLQATVARLPLLTQRQFTIGGLPAGGSAGYKASWEKLVRIVKSLRDAKVSVTAGTDAIPGLMLARELELFVEAGLPAAEAMRLATIEPARAMRLDKKTGSIDVGKVADLVVVDGDPLARVGDVRRVVTVYRAGVSYTANALLEEAGVRPMP